MAESVLRTPAPNKGLNNSFMGLGMASGKPKLLLHSCCGPCSTSVIERLVNDFKITVYYYNPCITERDEYEKRKKNQIDFIEAFNKNTSSSDKIEFLEGEYEPESYLKLIQGLEGEPEGGGRCKVCFTQRLTATAAKAKELGMDYFTTTLTVSPHKNYEIISSIAKVLSEQMDIPYLDMDFKKKAGFQRSVQLAKEYGLYRQDYCGCVFSKRHLDID